MWAFVTAHLFVILANKLSKFPHVPSDARTHLRTENYDLKSGHSHITPVDIDRQALT